MAELAKARSMQPYIILYKTTLRLGVNVYRALEADSRSLHSLSSQHKRLSPGSSDPSAVGGGGLSRGDSMTSIVSTTSLGSFTSSSQIDDCELVSIVS